MNRNTHFALGLALAIVSLLIACHKSDSSSDPAPNPCAGKTLTGANFNVMENEEATYFNEFTNWIPYACDTVYAYMSDINFVPLDTTGQSYTWKIGGATYTNKQVTVNFSTLPAGQNVVPVTLTLQKKKGLNACFPSDTGTVIYTKNVVFSKTTLVDGTYNGYRTDSLGKNPSDTFSITINSQYPFPITGTPDTTFSLRVNNLNPIGANTVPYNYLVIGYKEMESGDQGAGDGAISGKFILGPSNDEITIYYNYFQPTIPGTNTGSNSHNYIFKGKRVK